MADTVDESNGKGHKGPEKVNNNNIAFLKQRATLSVNCINKNYTNTTDMFKKGLQKTISNKIKAWQVN